MRDSFTVNNPHFRVWSDATCHMGSGKQKETSVALAELAKPILVLVLYLEQLMSGGQVVVPFKKCLLKADNYQSSRSSVR